jgi:hypothetical protein
VEEVGELLTMQLGPDQVLLPACIRFRRGLIVQQLESAIARLETEIRLSHSPALDRADGLQVPLFEM